ncbi:MAG: hypothetical protein ACRES3_10750 [Steroidobacteraceae bacterium]
MRFGQDGAGALLLRQHQELSARGTGSRALVAWNEPPASGTTTWSQWNRVRGRLQSLGWRIGLNYAVMPFGFGVPLQPLFRWATVIHFHNWRGP